MIDLHNHLLPGIDDGAKELEETLEFLRIGARDGVRTVTATPHMKPGVYDNSREVILERVAMVREAQRGDEAEAVTLLPGAEVYFSGDVVLGASRAGCTRTGHEFLPARPETSLPCNIRGSEEIPSGFREDSGRGRPPHPAGSRGVLA